MVESKSKGSVRLNREAMKAWEERIKEAQEAQEKRRRASKNADGKSSASA